MPVPVLSLVIFLLQMASTAWFQAGMKTMGRKMKLLIYLQTEEYKNRLKQVRKWYLKGYMGDNILENTSTITEMIRNGEAFAETVKNKPGMKMQESLKCEREMEIVQFGQPQSVITVWRLFRG